MAEDARPMSPQDKEALFKIPGNSKCCDCGRNNPEWASLSLATIICLECSGTHRGMGTHISFVRSIVMDSWTPSQLKRMKIGGNMECLEFLASHGIDIPGTNNNNNNNDDSKSSLPPATRSSNIRERYDTPAAELYQQVLKAKVDGTTPLPTKLPPKRNAKKKEMTKQQMTGFGSSAHPREVRKENRKKLAVVGSALVSVAAVVWGLSRKGGGVDGKRGGGGGGGGGGPSQS